MLSAGGAPDPEADDRQATARQLATLRQRITLLEHRLDAVELALTSRARGWVPGVLRAVLGRR